MKRIFAYIRPHTRRILLGLSVKFGGTVMDLLLPWILSYLIDTVVPTGSLPAVFLWGIAMLAISILALAGNVAANRMASKVARDTTQSIRYDLFEKITRLSCRQADEFTIPSLESRLTSDTYNIHQMVSMIQRMGVRAPILLVGGILVTLTIDPVLTLVLVSVLPFITLVVWLVSRKGIPLYTRLQKSADRMVRVLRENISGVRIIKALSKTAYEKERFAGINEEVSANERKAGITMGLTNPMMNLLLNVGLTLVVLAGAYRVNGGLTQPGVILAFLSYFTIILNAMLSITRIFVMISRGSASANRIAEVLDAPEDLRIQPEERVETPYHVWFDDVSFSYHKAGTVVSHISFGLEKGRTLGLIGATGCGKTTILQLLLRFYDPDSGKIRIDGQNVNSIPPEELYARFGVCFQNDVLFADTIAENVAFGRLLEQSRIDAAIRLAQAEPFISELPDGNEHMLAPRGTNLSGGQKQRLLIARALAAKPEILILDDSSSALDYKTDAKLRQAMENHFQETTVIIVAQRISSIKSADLILVLDEGEIIGRGAHEELLETCPAYREIAQSQMGDLSAGNLPEAPAFSSSTGTKEVS